MPSFPEAVMSLAKDELKLEDYKRFLILLRDRFEVLDGCYSREQINQISVETFTSCESIQNQRTSAVLACEFSVQESSLTTY